MQYAKVFPLAKTMGIKIPSKYLRIVVGWLEVLCGAVLIFVPGMYSAFNTIHHCITSNLI